jgi:Fe-S cluster assembly protein SufD
MELAINTKGKSDPALACASLGKEQVSLISQGLQEPSWMLEKRRTAWEVFFNTPMPTSKDEDWRRTSLNPIKWEKLAFSEETHSPVPEMRKLPVPIKEALNPKEKAAGRIVFMDGKLIFMETAEELREKGVIFCDLSTALKEHELLVKKHFMTTVVTPADGKFAAMNGAFWQGGIFLYLPKGVVIEEPFYTVFAVGKGGSITIPHSLIITEPMSQGTFIEETWSDDQTQQSLSDKVLEIVAGEDSHLEVAEVQRWGRNMINLSLKRAFQLSGSHVAWNEMQVGGRLTKGYIDNILAGNGSEMVMSGVYLLDGQQHMDLDTLMRHTGVATSGDLLLHGALKDKSRAVFQGMIKIDPSGQQTNSYLKNDNLILSDAARADSIPSLKIDANDVRASHGATVGKIDDEYLFYLMSRGIDALTAEKMIVDGFFSTAINRIKPESIRRRFTDVVEKKWQQA